MPPSPTSMRILVVGDLHFRDCLGYADCVPDGREGEKAAVLDAVIEASRTCSHAVLLGDQLNARNNSAKVVADFTAFLERFECPVDIIAGNHETSGDGKTAVDFVAEVKGKPWRVFREPTLGTIPACGTEDGGKLRCMFLPWIPKSLIGNVSDAEALGWLKDAMVPGDCVFMHYALGGFDAGSVNTDMFQEPVFDRGWLLSRYRRVFAGHVHSPADAGGVHIVGSVFTNEMGDRDKRVVVYDTSKDAVESVPLPSRPILKSINGMGLNSFPKNAIVKVEIRDRAIAADGIDLGRFDGSVVVMNADVPRRDVPEIGELTLENLMSAYAEMRGINLSDLKKGYEIATR